MPLPLPNLDDRRWADLVDEGQALIPRYAPIWTDHNVHDPGIMLLELFAWLTEMTIYRLNQVPGRHRLKFLALLGINPRPPRAAQTMLTFTPDDGTDPFRLPEGAEFEATDIEGQPVRFRTLRELTVAVVRLAAVQVDGGDGSVRDQTRDWGEGLPFAALGENPQPGAAIYLGFSELPTEVPLALALRFQGPGTDLAERARIIKEAAEQREACRHILPDISCDEADGQPEPPGPMLPPHHSAQVVWEVFTGPDPDAWTRLEPVTDLARPEVGQVMDDTRSLTLNGIVAVNLPPTLAQTTLGEVDDESLFYLRCRLVDGAYDAPPMLIDVAPNGVTAEQAVPVYQTFTIAAGVTPVGPAPTPGTAARLQMQLNTEGVIEALTFFEPADAPDQPDVLVLNYEPPTGSGPGQITLALILVGQGRERPDQQVTLPQAPVQVESFRLYTQTGDAWPEWVRRDDLDASGRTDFHFTLDATSGEITFGNGERGGVVPADALILAAYRTTRAARGSVAVATVTQPAHTPRNALWLAGLPDEVREQLPRITTNCVAATGGAAAETLAETTGRAVETLHAHQRLLDLCAETKRQTLDQVPGERVQALPVPPRAVNLLDLERLALDVPGTRVARVRAWAAFHPDYPCLQAPGVVTVVVVPDLPAVKKPAPSPGLLEAIKRHLDRRRMVCTRLEVVGPQYLEVCVSARVQTRPHTDPVLVKHRIFQALDNFLDPRSGGPDSLGWPFGRDVYRGEILQLIDGVPGVDHILELSLKAGAGEPQCGNLSLCPTWLAAPGDHQIEVG